MAKKLKALLDKIDDLPESYRELYEQLTDGEHKGKYALGVEPAGGMSLAEVEKLNRALLSERELRQSRDSSLKQFEGLGDIDVIRKALEDVKRMSSWTPDEKVQQRIDAAVADLRKAQEKESAKYKAEVDKREHAIRKLAIQLAARQALGKFKGDADLLMPHIELASDPVRVDGEDVPQIRLKADNGRDYRPSATPGAYMGIEEYVEKHLREKYPRAFDGDGRNGSGATGGSAGHGNGANGANRGGVLRVPAGDMKSLAKAERHLAKAKADGLRIETVPDSQ